MTVNLVSAARKTLSDVVYEEILGKIISLSLKPGEMIYENPIAAEFGVSRMPVREAFRRLVTDELIEILPQRGAQVAKLSLQKIEEAQFVREILEIGAFEKAAKMWDIHDTVYQEAEDRITEIIEKQKRAVQDQDYIRFVRLDEEFHDSIIEVTGNRTLLSMLSKMRAHLNRFRYLELQEAHHEKKGIAQHEEIFKAVKDNDVMKTSKLLEQHLKLLENFRLQIFEKNRDLFI